MDGREKSGDNDGSTPHGRDPYTQPRVRVSMFSCRYIHLYTRITALWTIGRDRRRVEWWSRRVRFLSCGRRMNETSETVEWESIFMKVILAGHSRVHRRTRYSRVSEKAETRQSRLDSGAWRPNSTRPTLLYRCTLCACTAHDCISQCFVWLVWFSSLIRVLRHSPDSILHRFVLTFLAVACKEITVNQDFFLPLSKYICTIPLAFGECFF